MPRVSASARLPGTATDDSEHTITAAALSAAGFTGNELLPLTDIRIGNNGGVLWNPGTATEVGYEKLSQPATITDLSGSFNLATQAYSLTAGDFSISGGAVTYSVPVR